MPALSAPSTPEFWNKPSWKAWLLSPLSLIYGLLQALHKALYQSGICKSQSLDVYTVVVGGINVGGSGKSPVVDRLVRELQAQGLAVGIIARGYGVKMGDAPIVLQAGHHASEVGDEPMMHFERLAVPVAVHPDRLRAGRALIDAAPLDVIVSDDGLQHYRLRADYTVCVLANEAPENRFLFPAGPWRAPFCSRKQYDLLLGYGGVAYRRRLGPARRLDGDQRQALSTLSQQNDWLAIAGIAHPQQFFEGLSAAGLRFDKQVFPDHYAYQVGDLDPDQPTLMTAKDAVKLREFNLKDAWVIELSVDSDEPWWQALISRYRAQADA